MDEYISRKDAFDILQSRLDSISQMSYLNLDLHELNIMRDAIQNAIDDIGEVPAADVQPIDDDNGHIIYIGRKAYLAENTIMEFMKKMDIIRDSLAYIENYFDTYAETIRQINACGGRCTDIAEVKYFIDRIKENSGYD